MARKAAPPRTVLDGESRERYELVLYISGSTPQSSATLQTLVAVCKERLEGRYDLIVVDVYQEPKRARTDQIIVAPTLVKRRPLPLRRMVGDLSDRAQLLRGLGLPLEANANGGK
ncbi:MAG TPA: circadian clock KaiB family protein [Polyangiaceae bacterium]|nr:circadian clock KaiB family protein [Polyangiaceae bacterium]